MNVTISYFKTQKFLRDQGAEKLEELIEGCEVWIKGGVVVKLQPNVSIDYEHLEAIATDQLSIHWWEFDYWLGENTDIHL